MIAENKSYTRITLALDIIQKVVSGNYKGYHELGIIKHQIELFDTITVETTDSDSSTLFCNDTRVPCDSSNICLKAVELVKKKYGIEKNVAIVIEKNIPVMGGLAGGSANAATTLELLNAIWHLDLTAPSLKALGKELGMDVPYFFEGGTVYDTEATGIMEKIDTNLQFDCVLVIPDFGVSTKDAYSQIDYETTGKDTEKTGRMIEGLKENCRQKVLSNMHNDFESTLFERYPGLQSIKNRLIEYGCEAAVVSGSGSTVIGIVETLQNAENVKNKMGGNVIVTKTIPGHPD